MMLKRTQELSRAHSRCRNGWWLCVLRYCCCCCCCFKCCFFLLFPTLGHTMAWRIWYFGQHQRLSHVSLAGNVETRAGSLPVLSPSLSKLFMVTQPPHSALHHPVISGAVPPVPGKSGNPWWGTWILGPACKATLMLDTILALFRAVAGWEGLLHLLCLLAPGALLPQSACSLRELTSTPSGCQEPCHITNSDAASGHSDFPGPQ